MRHDRASVRYLLLGLWMAAGVLAIVALLLLLDASLLQLLAILADAPWWLFAATLLLTFANQIIGALKWRAAAGWLTPEAPRIGLARLVEATTVGSFLGQFLPLQISVPLGRWLTLRGDGRGWVIRASVYEQVFDLVALLAGGVAGMFVFLFTPDAASVAAVFCLVVLACLSGLRIGLRLAASVFRWLARAGGPAARIAEALDRAARAPTRTLAALMAWSFARLAAVGLRAVVVALVFVPSVSPVLVAAAYPAAGLAVAVPLSPAGLGLAEWSWAGLLVLGGASAPTAAVAALAFRVVNMLVLSLLSAAVLALGAARRAGGVGGPG